MPDGFRSTRMGRLASSGTLISGGKIRCEKRIGMNACGIGLFVFGAATTRNHSTALGRTALIAGRRFARFHRLSPTNPEESIGTNWKPPVMDTIDALFAACWLNLLVIKCERSLLRKGNRDG